MKKIFIIIFLLLFATSLYAQQAVRVVPSPPQKILYDNDISGNSKEYFGWAALNSATSAAVWKIMRITYATASASDDFTIEWAEGTPSYTNIWDNRATTVTYK